MMKYTPDMSETYKILKEWFNDGNGEKVIEIGVYNDLVKKISISNNRIKIELSEKTLYVEKDELENLKIDKKWGMLMFNI